ncbi:MAG: hypothetical protein INH41_17235 [Myxococcaceae bacterium]|nr:hypothetical protein [Myxococcaceae bacterium]
MFARLFACGGARAPDDSRLGITSAPAAAIASMASECRFASLNGSAGASARRIGSRKVRSSAATAKTQATVRALVRIGPRAAVSIQVVPPSLAEAERPS